MVDEEKKRFIEFSRPLVGALKGIYESMFAATIETKGPEIKKDKEANFEISAYITAEGSLTSDSNTKIFAIINISWPLQSYINISNAMLMEEYTELNEEMQDVGPEVINMVTGNAKKDFKEAGFDITLSTPIFVNGKEPLPFPDSYIVTVPMDSSQGNFVMQFCYKEN